MSAMFFIQVYLLYVMIYLYNLLKLHRFVFISSGTTKGGDWVPLHSDFEMERA